ncbi:hypothetical protein [Aestuariivirga sp.]|uniref:hypothetical protein n=1 Tax=Aestuariivirga sp. TaxID=2650926 RepID=UPI00378470A7
MKSSLKSTTAIVTGTLGFGLMVTGALGADIDPGCVPAVSGLNGKLEGAGGYYQEDDSGDGGQFRGVGMLDVPLGCYFGLQLDMGGGDFGGNKWAGIGGHLFMRDPDAYLLGIQAQYISLDGEEIVRVGPEAELYLGDFTLSMMAGWEGADDFDMDDIVGQLEAAYYMDDNFKIFGGYRHFLGVDAAAIGFEFKPQSMPASLFVDAMFGTDEYVSVVGGLRIHFGGDTKSLKDTHRYDDPGHYFNLLRAPTNRQYVPPPVVDSPCPGDSCPKAP